MFKKTIIIAVLVMLVAMVGCSNNDILSDKKYTLTIEIEGKGQVNPSSGQKFVEGTTVSLKASPD
ncbi:hypothetical protein [Halothermothrix orenii]|uniref:hypothetical protein n=1 Tax=Halothermothrix orenii TaxID=31909 RepID=UPI0002FF35DA|nr:hypothetical protein [Halothermothrix orenii]